MAVTEVSGLMKYKDADGNVYIMLPVTTKDNVDGLEEIDAHIANKDNPHEVTPAKIGALELGTVACTLPSSSSWSKICYGDGKYVALALSTNIAAYSEDLITWEEVTLPASAAWRGIAYGNGMFVAISYNAGTFAYSTDGRNWTSGNMPSSAYWCDVTFGNGVFVAISYSSSKVAYSVNGTNWTAATLPSSANWWKLCYGNGKFVAITMGNNKAAYSSDGKTWTSATLPSATSWNAITYGNGKFLVTATSGSAAYSTDGATWTASTLSSDTGWISVAYGNGVFAAVATNTALAAYSTDGANWTQATMPVSASWEAMCYGSVFVAIASNTNAMAISVDGMTWSNGVDALYQSGNDVTDTIKDLVRHRVTPIASGGTGATTAAQARINLGIQTVNGTTTSGNADYAEVGEWADGNADDEDRIGYFVAVDTASSGTTMVKATSTADVHGVTVSSPAFSGNCSADKFGENGALLKQYDFVAVMGFVSVIDNGTCTINERCIPTDDGTAIPSSNNMGYQVIDRVDDTHILIAVEPGADMLNRIKTDVTELQTGKASTSTYTANVTETWTEDSTNGGYYQTVAITGILSTDNPIADVVLGSDVDANAVYLEAWGAVTRITTADGSITLYANGNAPTSAFTCQLKVVR